MRSRTLKPEIFSNKALAILGSDSYRLFTGLLCMADREGRLKDDPGRIEAKLFPFKFQIVNIQALLGGLAGGDDPFIIRYDGFIQIVNFSKHQHPHPREVASTIPPPSRKQARPRHGLGNTKALSSPSGSSGSSLSSGSSGSSGIAAAPPAPPPEPPYKRPDAKTEPLRTLVFGYKLKKGFPAEDRTWDRQVWPRASKAGKLILEAFDGHLRSALTCLESLADDYDKKGLDWTLETIEKHCLEWKLKHGGYGHGATGGERVFDDFVKRGAKGKSERGGGFASAGAIIAGMGVVPNVSLGSRREERLPDHGNGGALAGVEPQKLEGQPDRGPKA